MGTVVLAPTRPPSPVVQAVSLEMIVPSAGPAYFPILGDCPQLIQSFAPARDAVDLCLNSTKLLAERGLSWLV